MNQTGILEEVLIIDDDIVSLYAQAQLLETLQIAPQITAMEEAGQALDFIQQHWIAAEKAGRKKLLLLDWRMPQMSGMEFLERFAAMPNTQDIAIVVLSAIVPDFVRNHAQTFKVVDCFDKPLTKSKVEQLLKKLAD